MIIFVLSFIWVIFIKGFYLYVYKKVVNYDENCYYIILRIYNVLEKKIILMNYFNLRYLKVFVFVFIIIFVYFNF